MLSYRTKISLPHILKFQHHPGSGSLYIVAEPATNTMWFLTSQVGKVNWLVGLKINIHESKLMGIGIPQVEVNIPANLIGSMYGDHGALDSSGSVSRHSLWNNIIRELGTLSLIVLFRITAAPIKLVLLKKKVNDAGTKDNTASVQS
ncbi:hypothetical protein Tco_0937438 [Tanacetum coccineum]|uniref:Uncharacterized protein n=1 Tax=Tanacetum coccineum TaxID=301880 RepID=A0ABQ5DH20_9ASTR